MSAQGVISESLISFNVTWSNPGKGQQSKWDQTKQGIEIHETDVYPDLQYTSAYAAPLYVKYTSGALLNDLISEINKIIDARIASESSKKNEAKEALPPGPDVPKQLAGYSPGGDLVKVEEPGLPAIIDTKPEEIDVPDVTPDETAAVSDYAYTVVVKGDRLRFLEGQQERGAYSAGVKFLYQVSNNLSKVVSGEAIDNKTKISAEISMSGLLGRTFRMEFPEFDEKEFKFGGNLLAQILPSIELSFTPDQNSVYSKEKPELDIADVIKATNITLGNKTTSEIKALQKQIQKEIEAREPSQSEGSSDKQVASDKNK